MQSIIEAIQIIHTNNVFTYSNNPNWSNILSHPESDIEYWIGFIYDIWGIKKSKILIKITTLVDYLIHFPNDPVLEDTLFVWYFIARELNLKYSIQILEDKINKIRCSNFITKINEILNNTLHTNETESEDSDNESDDSDDEYFENYTSSIKSQIRNIKKENNTFDSVEFNKTIDKLKKERSKYINDFLKF